MAITGRFIADFSSFQAAVQQAETSLRSFETGAGKVETSLNRLVDSFSGRKIIQDATLAAEAIERIGGTSTLTESEMARVSATAGEAAAKLKAMGLDVPPGIQKIADQAKATTGAFEGMGSTVRTLAGAFGITFGIGAVVQFGREVLHAGDAIQKMADQTGLSLQEVQKLQYVAGQSGTSIESLVGALQLLQQRLGDDSTGAAGAIKRLGINFDAFLKLSPYDQMVTLADGIKGIEDPTERASVAGALFGKTWKEILPAIVAGMREVGNAAPVMSDAAVKAADAWGDAMARMKQSAIVAGGTIVENITKIVAAFHGDFSNIGTGLTDLGADLNGLEGALAKVPPPALAVADGLKGIGVSASEASRIEKELNETAQASIAAHEKEAAALKAQEEAMRRLTQAQQDHIHSIADKLFGIDDIKRATDYAEAIGRVENISNLNAEAQAEVVEVMRKGNEAMIAAGRGTDELTSKFTEMGIAATQSGREAAAAYELIRAEAAMTAAALAAYNAQGAALATSIQASGTGVWTSDMAVPAPKPSPNIWSSPLMEVPSLSGIRPRAMGGSVSGGSPYMVGERGPELFVPSSGGSIVPNGGITNVTIYVNGTAEDVARKVAAEFERTMKVGRKWPAN